MKKINLHTFEILEYDDVYDNLPPKANKVKHETLDVSNVTPEQLTKEVAALKKEIEQLKTSKYYTEVAKTREDVALKLAALEGDLNNYQDVSDISNMVEDGKISKGFLGIGSDKKKIERRIKKIQKFRADVNNIKQQLGIDTTKGPSNNIPQLPVTRFDKDGNIILSDTKSNTPKQTNAQILALKKSGAEKIKSGDNPNAQELQAMGAEGAVTNYLTKYTNATPKQAKTIAMLGAGAALFYGVKWLIKDGFSAKTLLKLGGLYAGVTMATGEDPISFLTKFYKGGSYDIPGVISKEDLGQLANSPLHRTIGQQALMEGLFSGFKNPEDLTRYLSYENGQFAFDTGLFFDDANINPSEFYENTLSNNTAIGKNVLLSVLCAYKQNKPGELNKIINDYLVGELELDGDVLKDPKQLKTKIDDYRKGYRKDLAIRKQEFLQKNPNIKIVPGMESMVDQEIMRKDTVFDSNGKATKVFHYDLATISGRSALESILKQVGLIQTLSYAENIALKQEDERMLNDALNHITNPKEKESFIKGFMEAKAILGNENLAIKYHDNQLYIQNSGYKLPIMGDSNNIIIDFTHFSDVNKFPLNFTSYKDAILFGAAINKLFSLSIGAIDYNSYELEDKDGELLDGTKNLRPFSYSNLLGGELKLYNNRGAFASKIGSRLGPINNIFHNISSWKGELKNRIPTLATALNSLKYPGSNTPIYVEGKGELPQEMIAIRDNGTTIDVGDEIDVIYNEDSIYKILKTGGYNILSDLGNGVYKVTKNTLKGAMELTAEVVTGSTGKNTLVLLTGDIRNQGIVPGVGEIYKDAKTGLVMVSKDIAEEMLPYLGKKIKDGVVWLIDDLGKQVGIVAIHAGKTLFKVAWNDAKELIVDSIYPDMKDGVKQLFDDLIDGMKLGTDKAMEVVANIFSEKNLTEFHKIIDGMGNIVGKTIDEVVKVFEGGIKSVLGGIRGVIWSGDFWKTIVPLIIGVYGYRFVGGVVRGITG